MKLILTEITVSGENDVCTLTSVRILDERRPTREKRDDVLCMTKLDALRINADHLCMARAIAMSWAKLHTVTTEEWQTTAPKGCEVTHLLRHQMVPREIFC